MSPPRSWSLPWLRAIHAWWPTTLEARSAECPRSSSLVFTVKQGSLIPPQRASHRTEPCSVQVHAPRAMTAGGVASPSGNPNIQAPLQLFRHRHISTRGTHFGRCSSDVSQRATLVVAASDTSSLDDPSSQARNLRLGRLDRTGHRIEEPPSTRVLLESRRAIEAADACCLDSALNLALGLRVPRCDALSVQLE
jgi:hypothetical protein